MHIRDAFQKLHSQPRVNPPAFLLFGTSPIAGRSMQNAILRETPAPVVSYTDLLKRTATVRNLMEMRDVFCVNVTGASLQEIQRSLRLLESVDYAPTIYVLHDHNQMISESWLRANMVSGSLLREYPHDAVLIAGDPGNTVGEPALLMHMKMVLEAEIEKPKQPTEVDRLKIQQQGETITMKQRQAQEMLAAQQRELQKKAREDMAKISKGEKHPTVTR